MPLTTLLTETQMQTLKAAADRIVPADDSPSAWDAGAETFFARLFERQPDFLPRYQTGLDRLNSAAGGAFAALDASAQDALLRGLEVGPALAEFVGLLIEQTLESFYADPGNGGNSLGVSWDMIGHKITA